MTALCARRARRSARAIGRCVSPAPRASPTARCCWPGSPRALDARRPAASPMTRGSMAAALRDLGSASPSRPTATAICAGCRGSRRPADGPTPRSTAAWARPSDASCVPMLAAGERALRGRRAPAAAPPPLGPVLAALRAQGAVIDGEAFPLVHRSPPGSRGGEVTVDASVSSQFLSGLLMAAPFARGRTRGCASTRSCSKPYLDLTLDAMRAFGVEVEVEPDAMIGRARRLPGHRVRRSSPMPRRASYFLASAALTGTTVALAGPRPAHAPRRVTSSSSASSSRWAARCATAPSSSSTGPAAAAWGRRSTWATAPTCS